MPTPIPDPLDRPFVGVEEAAQMLELGRDAAYSAVKKGEIPSIRLGRSIRVPTAELRRLAGLDQTE